MNQNCTVLDWLLSRPSLRQSEIIKTENENVYVLTVVLFWVQMWAISCRLPEYYKWTRFHLLASGHQRDLVYRLPEYYKWTHFHLLASPQSKRLGLLHTMSKTILHQPDTQDTVKVIFPVIYSLESYISPFLAEEKVASIQAWKYITLLEKLPLNLSLLKLNEDWISFVKKSLTRFKWLTFLCWSLDVMLQCSLFSRQFQPPKLTSSTDHFWF